MLSLQLAMFFFFFQKRLMLYYVHVYSQSYEDLVVLKMDPGALFNQKKKREQVSHNVCYVGNIMTMKHMKCPKSHTPSCSILNTWVGRSCMSGITRLIPQLGWDQDCWQDAPITFLCLLSTWGHQKLKRATAEKSCFALAEKIWKILNGRIPQTQLCCSSNKCMFLRNMAPSKRDIIRLSNSQRFIAKKRCYNKEKIDLTQISLILLIDGEMQ